jgi:hypothetical protein
MLGRAGNICKRALYSQTQFSLVMAKHKGNTKRGGHGGGRGDSGGGSRGRSGGRGWGKGRGTQGPHLLDVFVAAIVIVVGVKKERSEVQMLTSTCYSSTMSRGVGVSTNLNKFSDRLTRHSQEDEFSCTLISNYH